MTDLLEAPVGVAPRLGDGVELLGEYQSSGFIEQKFLLRRPDGQVVQVSHLLYLIASRLDGRRQVQAIADEVGQEFGRRVSAANVAFLLEQRLHPLGLLEPAEGEERPLARSTPLLSLGMRAAFFPAGLVKALTRPLLFLFRPAVVWPVVVGVLAVDIWLFFFHGVTASALLVATNPALVALILAIGAVSGIWHELGHATACRFGGADPGRIGWGIFLIWPAFYSDVTDTYRLNRAGRLRTDLGGVYFNAVGVLVLAGLYAVTGWELLLIVILFEQLQILQQGIPFLRLDGYHVLSDLVGVPDLFGRIRPILASLLPGAKPGPRVTELRPRVRVVVTVWVALTTVLLSGGLVFFLIFLPTWITAGTDSFNQRVSEASRMLGDGNHLGAAFEASQAGMLLVPALGVGLIGHRLIKLRRTREAAKESAAARAAGPGMLEAQAIATPRVSVATSSTVSVVVGVAATLGLGVALVQAPWLFALLFVTVAAVLTLVAVLRRTAANDPDDRAVAHWVYAAFGLHLGLGLGLRASGYATRIFGAADGDHLRAQAILQHWSEGTPLPPFAAGDAGFSYGLARLYQLVGPQELAGLVVTSLCAALTVALVADTTRRLFGLRARLSALPLLVLLPGLALWTTQVLRVAAVLAALALAANLTVRLSEQLRLGRLGLLGATIAALFALRPTVAYVAAVGLVVGLVVGGRRAAAVAAAVALVTGVAVLLALGGAVGGSAYERTADARRSETVRVDPNAAPSPSAGVADLPSELPQFLLGPGSPEAGGLRRALGVIEAASLWFLLPFLVRGLSRARRLIDRRAAILLAPALALTVALTLLMGGSEALITDRLQVLVLLLPFAALGRVRRAQPATASAQDAADGAVAEGALRPQLQPA